MADQAVISETTVIRGNISGEGSLRIDGKVRGDVQITGDLTLGPTGAIVGDVNAALLSIAGSVIGNLIGTDGVHLQDGARVVGDLRAPTVGVDEGALVRGAVESNPSEGTGRVPARTTSARRPLARAVTPPPRARAVPTRESIPEPSVREVAPPREASLATREAAAPRNTEMTARSPEKAAPEAKVAPRKKASAKAPPPPVVAAPRKGARGRKKTAKK